MPCGINTPNLTACTLQRVVYQVVLDLPVRRSQQDRRITTPRGQGSVLTPEKEVYDKPLKPAPVDGPARRPRAALSSHLAVRATYALWCRACQPGGPGGSPPSPFWTLLSGRWRLPKYGNNTASHMASTVVSTDLHSDTCCRPPCMATLQRTRCCPGDSASPMSVTLCHVNRLLHHATITGSLHCCRRRAGPGPLRARTCGRIDG